MTKPDLTRLIRLIEAQTRALGLSEREASRRAGSEGLIANIKKGSMPAWNRLGRLMGVLGIEAGELRDALGDYGAGDFAPPAFGGGFAEGDLSGEDRAPPGPAPDHIRGEVQAGHWLEAAEWPRGDWIPLVIPVDAAYEYLPRFGLMVRGPSMNRLYPDGSVLVCVKLIDLGRNPYSGERVIVHRERADAIVEATVKEYVEYEGRKLLMPRSDHPDHQTPLDLTDPGGEGPDETIAVTALVIGSYRPERPVPRARRAPP